MHLSCVYTFTTNNMLFLLMQAMEALRDEIEDIEEALEESVRDAVTDRNKVRVASFVI